MDNNPVPERHGFVNDYASVFSNDDAASLDADLKEYEKETCHQIFLLTVSSLKGEPISNFSTRTATAWKIGQPKLNNGILLTIAVEDGSARFEASSGLDFLVKEGTVEQIMNKKMFPRFREGNLTKGIRDGLEAIKSEARKMSYPDTHKPAVCR